MNGGRLAAYREWYGLTQPELVSRLADLAEQDDGRRAGVSVEMVSRWERGVVTPSPRYRSLLCRLYQATPAQLGLRPPLPGEATTPPWDQDTTRVARRDLLRAGAYVGGLAASSSVIGRLADAISFSSLASAGLPAQATQQTELATLRRRIEGHWRLYQSGAYRPLLAQLPVTLSSLQGSSVQRNRAVNPRNLFDLQSRAYQLAASVAYKFGDPTLGLLAAERGVAAAGYADDPLLGGVALTRLAHGLRDTGHEERATDLTLRAAATLDDAAAADASHASVYGALLLHSAIAVARQGDSGTARSLLAEAAGAAGRTGEANHYYTAFGPTNVAAWSVAIALRLGDPAAALKSADAINVNLLPVGERKAAFLIDRATACAQQGGRDATAVDVLLAAERIAPDEVYGRPEARQLVDALSRRGRPTWRRPLAELSERMRTAR